MEIGEVVVTKDEQGRIALVTRQDDEGRILSVIAESKPWPKKLAPTYFVLHPDGSYTAADPQPYLPDLDQPAGEPDGVVMERIAARDERVGELLAQMQPAGEPDALAAFNELLEDYGNECACADSSPDSTYTKKCIAKARKKVVDAFIARAAPAAPPIPREKLIAVANGLESASSKWGGPLSDEWIREAVALIHSVADAASAPAGSEDGGTGK